MFDYMTAQEAAEKWNVSIRWVQRLCKEKRIEGIMNINHVWLIPKDAKKPTKDRHKKSGETDEIQVRQEPNAKIYTHINISDNGYQLDNYEFYLFPFLPEKRDFNNHPI